MTLTLHFISSVINLGTIYVHLNSIGKACVHIYI